MLILQDGNLVIGDSKTAPFRGSIGIESGVITAVEPGRIAGGPKDVVVDLNGRLAMPGAIDAHVHAVAPGPRFASGTPGVSTAEVLGNLRRHLLQGHTTVVDLDGFKVPDETNVVRALQPVKIEAATVHFPPMLEAADASDGTGLAAAHRQMTIEDMVRNGAVVIGEVGAGMTLGGGGQDYMYIPAAVKSRSGVQLDAIQSRTLKYAVLGRHIRPGSPDRAQLAGLLDLYGLGALTVDDIIDVINQSVLPSFQIALDGIIESANQAIKYQIPTLVHNSAPSDEAVREAAIIAKTLLIAGHTNHGTYTAEECVANARVVREHGGTVEVDTFDAWGKRNLHKTPEHLIALMQEGLVDIIATDYAAGYWDGIWNMVAGIAQIGLVPVEVAIAMATGNVARAIPRIGNTRGLLKPGMSADVVVTNAKCVADIEIVFINGEIEWSANPLLS